MDAAQDSSLLAGRYQLGSVIGHGGMGTVWEARDALLDRDVAIKEMAWPSYLSEAEEQAARHRALREAQLAARLRHPNIVGIYDIVDDGDHPWIVMELIQYRSLRDVVREDGPLPPAQAAQIGLGILAALRAAHAEGIVHRDVKPANILVCPDGRAVLTDFGIARAADSPTLTSDELIGSPSYIAPERASGGQAGPAADLWALGAALYAAVEGRAPFEREDALASLMAAVTTEPEPATHAGPLWPAISGLLRKDPGRRLGPAEADAMLRQAMRDGDARPQPPGGGHGSSAPVLGARGLDAPVRGARGLSAPRWRSRRVLGALAATLAATAIAATAFALPQGNPSGGSPTGYTAGPTPGGPASPGSASATPSGGPASPSPATSSPKGPKHGDDEVTDSSGASQGVPPGHQHHGHGNHGQKGN